MRSLVLALVLALGLVGTVGGSAEAGKKQVDWSAYLESPSERAASAPVTQEARPKATATNAKAKRVAKAKAKAKGKGKAKARTKAKRPRRK